MIRSELITNKLRIIISLIMICSSISLAGGFEISVKDPGNQDAFLIVIPDGCHQPSNAKIYGIAEGIVDGERKSIKLQFTKNEEGVFTLPKQWSDEGVWVLVINGTYRGLKRSAIVEVGKNEKSINGSVKKMNREVSSVDIETALKKLKEKYS